MQAAHERAKSDAIKAANAAIAAESNEEELPTPSGMNAEDEGYKVYAYNCWDPCRLDDDPAVYDTWQVQQVLEDDGAMVEVGYVNLRTGEQKAAFPGECVHARKLYKCLGCACLFRDYSTGYSLHAYEYPHLGGELPAGPVPDPRDLWDDPQLCPSLTCTFGDECEVTSQRGRFLRPSNFCEIYHYVTLRVPTLTQITHISQVDVPILQGKNCWDSSRTREEEFAQMRQDLHNSRVARNVARDAAAKAEKEVTVLKGIIASLTATRTPTPAQPANPLQISMTQHPLQISMTQHALLPPPPMPVPIARPQVFGKRPAESSPTLAPLKRSQIATLPRASARLYLKSIGSSQRGEPEELRSRLTALFDANGIADEYSPGVTQIHTTK